MRESHPFSTGAGLTRNWPTREVAGEERDHKHHRGLWYAHGKVNGVDFWTEGATKGRIVHRGFQEIKADGRRRSKRGTTGWPRMAG